MSSACRSSASTTVRIVLCGSRGVARLTRVFFAALLVCSMSGRAAAQDKEELARARASFQQAVELGQAGNCSAALPLFRQVGQVRMTPQVRFHIAACEAQLGRLVAALGGFELALADADSVGAGFRDEVETNIKRLRERIPRLLIQRGSGAETAAIELDGVALGSGSIGVEVPLDPGPHEVSAEARGYESFAQTVTLDEGELETLEIALEPLPEQPATDPSGQAPLQIDTGSKLGVVPYVIGGVGVASLVTSGVLFALRQGSLNEMEEACGGRRCPEGQRDEYDRLKGYHYGSLATLGVGVAAIGAAATILVLDSRPTRETHARVSVIPKLLPTEASATVRLRF